MIIDYSHSPDPADPPPDDDVGGAGGHWLLFHIWIVRVVVVRHLAGGGAST
jgi:hypothetical protein